MACRRRARWANELSIRPDRAGAHRPRHARAAVRWSRRPLHRPRCGSTFDGGDTVDVALGPESCTPAGQVVVVPAARRPRADRRDRRAPTCRRPAASYGVVGSSEVGSRRPRRSPRPCGCPSTSPTAIGGRADGHRLDVVLSRLRYDPAARPTRSSRSTGGSCCPTPARSSSPGTARVDPNAPDAVIDDVLGTTAPGTVYSASDHLAGRRSTRARRARSTVTRRPRGRPQLRPSARAVGRRSPCRRRSPSTTSTSRSSTTPDHSVPTAVHPRRRRRAVALVHRRPGTRPSGTEAHPHASRSPFDPVTGRELRLYVDDVVHRVGAPGGGPAGPSRLPVVDRRGGDRRACRSPPHPATVPDECRADLRRSERRAGAGPASWAQARRRASRPRARGVRWCARPPRGQQHARGRPWGSTPASMSTGSCCRRTPTATPPRQRCSARRSTSRVRAVRVVSTNPVSRDLQVRTDGTPFWLVLGESANRGWEADVSGGTARRRGRS